MAITPTLAFLALVVAVGGSFASAGQSPAPKRTVAYHVWDTQDMFLNAGKTEVARIPFPAKGLYSVSAKVDLLKDTDDRYATGTVTCELTGGAAQFDDSVVSLAPGEAANLTLSSVGAYRAARVTCRSAAGPYLLANVRMTAIALDAAKVCPLHNSQGPTCKL